MTNNELKLLQSAMDHSKSYLEFGSGNSTYMAVATDNIKKITVVESDVTFWETGHSLGAWQTCRTHDRHQTARHQHAGTDGQVGGLSARLTEEFACGRQSLHGYFPPEPLYRKLYRQREKVSF